MPQHQDPVQLSILLSHTTRLKPRHFSSCVEGQRVHQAVEGKRSRIRARGRADDRGCSCSLAFTRHERAAADCAAAAARRRAWAGRADSRSLRSVDSDGRGRERGGSGEIGAVIGRWASSQATQGDPGLISGRRQRVDSIAVARRLTGDEEADVMRTPVHCLMRLAGRNPDPLEQRGGCIHDPPLQGSVPLRERKRTGMPGRENVSPQQRPRA